MKCVHILCPAATNNERDQPCCIACSLQNAIMDITKDIIPIDREQCFEPDIKCSLSIPVGDHLCDSTMFMFAPGCTGRFAHLNRRIYSK